MTMQMVDLEILIMCEKCNKQYAAGFLRNEATHEVEYSCQECASCACKDEKYSFKQFS